MCRPSSTLYTRKQVELIFRGWQCSESTIPPKGKKAYVCFAGQFIDLAEVEWTDLKSDVGERLWRITVSSKEGREFSATVCEAHVVARHQHLAEQRRVANLARYQAVAG
jgi:hypothetical protein